MSLKEIELTTLVPGARIELISKANIRYRGTLLNIDDKNGKLELANVQSFGSSSEAELATTADHIQYEYVIFRQSQLKEVKVLDDAVPWATDPAVDKAVENCTADSRAVAFTKEVWSWVEKKEFDKVKVVVQNTHLHEHFEAAAKTLLHRAVQHNGVSIVRNLLKMGCDVNVQDAMGMTALMMAMKAYKERIEVGSTIMKAILAAGADIFISNAEGRSAISMFCADYRDLSIIGKYLFGSLRKKGGCSEAEVNTLIDAGCTIYQVYENLKDLRAIEIMLERGLPVDELDSDSNESVLHSAMISQDVECVQLLLKHGANPEVEDCEGETPLSRMHMYDGVEAGKEAALVQLLLDHGASPLSCITPEGGFQAMRSLAYGEKQVIGVLLRYGLDFTATDEYDGQYVLHYLAENPNPGVVEELQRYRDKINVNVRNGKGETPLHFAATLGSADMVAFLLCMGAEVDCRTLKGFTPLYSLCAEPDVFNDPARTDRCVELLLQHYADPQFVVARPNGTRTSVFGRASSARDLNVAKPLVAQIAILEGLGTPITKLIRAKIASKPALKEHLNACRRLLRREVSGSVTLLKLLSADKKKMARFLNNENLALEKDSLLRELRASSLYYHNTLKKKYEDGASHKLLREIAAESVANILGENFEQDSLMVDRIIVFLDEESLKCLGDVF